MDKITGDTLTSELGTFNATTEVRRETPQPLVWKPSGNAVQNHTRARPNAAPPRQSGVVEIGIVSRGLVTIASSGEGDAVGAIDVTVPNSFNGEYMLRRDEGSVALSLCTSAHPLYTRFANIFGASISEPTMRPNPRHEGGGKAAKDPGLLLVRTQQLAIVGTYLQVRRCWAAVRLELSGPPSRQNERRVRCTL